MQEEISGPGFEWRVGGSPVRLLEPVCALAKDMAVLFQLDFLAQEL
jgi:hypothetical protein